MWGQPRALHMRAWVRGESLDSEHSGSSGAWHAPWEWGLEGTQGLCKRGTAAEVCKNREENVRALRGVCGVLHARKLQGARSPPPVCASPPLVSAPQLPGRDKQFSPQAGPLPHSTRSLLQTRVNDTGCVLRKLGACFWRERLDVMVRGPVHQQRGSEA